MKYQADHYLSVEDAVAPPVGAWIEIFPLPQYIAVWWSLPPWERGLKLKVSDIYPCFFRRSPRGSVD